jgi:hypothetical protein
MLPVVSLTAREDAAEFRKPHTQALLNRLRLVVQVEHTLLPAF